jgi:hypothetical protein
MPPYAPSHHGGWFVQPFENAKPVFMAGSAVFSTTTILTNSEATNECNEHPRVYS